VQSKGEKSYRKGHASMIAPRTRGEAVWRNKSTLSKKTKKKGGASQKRSNFGVVARRKYGGWYCDESQSPCGGVGQRGGGNKEKQGGIEAFKSGHGLGQVHLSTQGEQPSIPTAQLRNAEVVTVEL